ncbi:MAG: AAA family ATPase, partial [Xanthomonadales bacterium]|nr:AAA family ATPase [Xanthomonadales bacterium]
MLVEFSVANYRSILEEQTLSLVASAGKELRDTHVCVSGAPATPDLLRSAVIYGANASGKSNLLIALDFARAFVRDSARKGQPGEPIDHHPFAVELEDGQRPPATVFRFVFVQKKVRYLYAFAFDREQVTGEWLTAYPEGRPQMWFSREVDADRSTTGWTFGPNLRGQKKVWQEATRPNALLLSTAAQLNAGQMLPVYEWFSTTLRTIKPFALVHEGFTAKQCGTDESWRDQVQTFLARSDLGITALQVDCRQFDPASLDASMPESLRTYLSESMKGQEVADVRLTHRTKSGKQLTLDL